jgi:hypothetical protein
VHERRRPSSQHRRPATAVTARSAAYAGLARCVTILAGGSLTIDGRVPGPQLAAVLAEGLVRQRGQQTNKLYALLRVACDP